ncbi:copper chaperone PCu(A)C [Variovorax sp. VNK109]|jgi:copper(I)-binding protein|uniref:copper chaperone PCu(A)C n=1 Tax=Variovorax sp. VNK109 TaxID=3400919 RepID=UPI003C0068C6
MNSTLRSLFVVASMLASAAQAQVNVKDPWVRATVPQQQATGAFMQITAAKDTRLVSASSPLTPNVEVHEMAMQDNIMRMRQVPSIELPAGKPVDLKPGGYHVMFMNLKAQVKAGDTVPITLVFEDKTGRRETVEIKAPVRPLNSSAAPAATHGDHKH